MDVPDIQLSPAQTAIFIGNLKATGELVKNMKPWGCHDPDEASYLFNIGMNIDGIAHKVQGDLEDGHPATTASVQLAMRNVVRDSDCDSVSSKTAVEYRAMAALIETFVMRSLESNVQSLHGLGEPSRSSRELSSKSSPNR